MPATPALLLSACLSASAAGAPYLVPIINADFEQTSRPMNIGEITNGAGGAGVFVGTRDNFNDTTPDYTSPVEVPGWRTFVPVNPASTVRAGVMTPPIFPGGAYITNYSGSQLATLQITPLQQTLPFLVQPNTRYTLTFRAGIGRFDSDYAAFAALIAVPDTTNLYFRGNAGTVTLVGTLGENFDMPGDNPGVMRTIAIEYLAPSVLPTNVQGKYLCVALNGSDGFPRMNYDDFSLLATPVRCPGDFNADGLVDTADLVLLLGVFGQTVPPGTPQDMNSDGAVNTQDLAAFLGVFGTPC